MAEAPNSSPIYIPPTKQYANETAHSGPGSTNNLHDVKQRVNQLATDAKRITKRALHIDYTKEQIGRDEHAAPREINKNTGFNPSQTLDVEAGTFKQIKNKLPKPQNLKELGHIIRHPKDVGTEQASKTLDASENPNISREDDNKLIDAHEKLKGLEASDPLELGVEEQIVNLHGSIDEIEEDRQRKQVAWISSRYVSGGQVIPDEQYRFPFLSSCRWVDESGKPQGVQWSQWVDQFRNFVHHVRTEKPSPAPNQTASESNNDDKKAHYDQEILLQEFERIVISSNPIQRWISDLLKLRNWQNPRRTALWLVTWLVVWTCNRFFFFVYLYSAYKILQTRTAFDKRESLKESHNRANADDEMSNTLSEMITRHGSTNWLQSTIDSVGPTVQPKLRSLADWLEIFLNFPEAKTRRATIAIISTLVGASLIATFTSTAFCVRAIELVLILLFFVDTPLAGRYSRYRSVIVPLHWILWDVPTNTESSFRYLRQRAQEIRKGTIQQQPTSTKGVPPLNTDTINTPNVIDVDLLATKCKWRQVTGSVVLTRRDIRFMRNVPEREVWRRQFEDIVMMRKGDGRTSFFKQVEHFLELRFKNGSIERLQPLKKNDEVFNLIFAFSELQWQQV
jgi:hypothetical protein